MPIKNGKHIPYTRPARKAQPRKRLTHAAARKGFRARMKDGYR